MVLRAVIKEFVQLVCEIKIWNLLLWDFVKKMMAKKQLISGDIMTKFSQIQG